MKTIKEAVSFPKPTIIPINGIELEIFESGKEHRGNPIVMCHGFPEHAFSWRYQIPALVKAGYHVIVPNQRGYGNSSRPTEVSAYDIIHLTNDLVALLEYYRYKKATFVGHDWGANVVWHLALLHPERVNKVINLALPYQDRGDKPWLEVMEAFLGEDFYFVHFNNQPGVSDAVLEKHTANFFHNLFRKNVPLLPPEPGMLMMNLAKAENPLGEPIMSEDDLSVFIESFKKSGFTGSINWYRNLDRNWHLLADVKPKIEHSTLMVYGDKDVIPKSQTLTDFAPNLDVVSLDCGHHIQQELPEETNEVILTWLVNQ
ncbi:MAG: alpha/beta hydrolase [Maribacter dokdonensis]|uniref:alpha/beta fold hydrolase n=1 Tax=Maribacter dokdonensis TaxID=320912 RepID=UPI0032975458